MKNLNGNKIAKLLEYLFLISIILASAFYGAYQNKISILMILMILGIQFFIFMLSINNFDFEKTILIFFILAIPFFVDLDFIRRSEDFHMAAKPYIRFNIMYIFAGIFIFFIIKNINKIKQSKVKYDLIIIGIFLLICFSSMIWAINPAATFFDALRYLVASIYYVYFSRVFDYKKYNKTVMTCLVISIVLQLAIGCLQIIKGGPVGLHILGESKSVFRASVEGYEKGMSGTFGHPGPIALYSSILLSWLIFKNDINKFIKYIGVISAILIIVLAAGRTSIVLMLFILMVYVISNIKLFKLKEIKLNKKYVIVSTLAVIILAFIFREKIMFIIDRFVGSDIIKQFNSRGDHIKMALYYIKQNSLLGLGLNNYLDYTIVEFADIFKTNFIVSNPIHNAYLLFAVEIGILGAIAYISIIISNLYYYILFKKCKVIKKYQEYKGILLSIVVCSIYNLQGWGALHNRNLIIFFIGIGMLYNLYYKET